MITTITLNPCIDRTVEIKNFSYGGTNLVLNTKNDISGKGINVNRVLQKLDIENMALGFNYLNDSKKLHDELEKIGCHHEFVDVNGSLRVNIKIFDNQTTVMSEFNEKGEEVFDENIQEFMKTLKKNLSRTSILVVNGSVPPGISCSIYKEIINMAKEKNVKCILDAKCDLLKQGLEALPLLIKPNEKELSETYGVVLETERDIINLSKKIVKKGIKYVCVSRAEKGAVFITSENVYKIDPIEVTVKGVQGAGDSMVAGFCYAISNNMSEVDIIKYGVACATGSLVHKGTELCGRKDLNEFLPQVVLHKL